MASADNNDNGTTSSVSNPDANGREDALVPVEFPGGAAGEMGWPMGFPMKPEILNATPTMATMYGALRRRWPLALGLGLLLSVSGMLLALFLVPIQYTAVARLRVSYEKDGILVDKPKPVRDIQIEIHKETQRALIKSTFVLLAATRKNDIAQLPIIKEQGDDYIAWLQENIRAAYTSQNSEILDIKIKYRDKKQAIRLVDAVQEAYLTEVVQKARSEKLQERDKLQLELSNKQGVLHKRRLDLKTLMDTVGDPDSDQHRAAMAAFVQEIKGLGLQKSNVQAEVFNLNLRRDQIRELNSKGEWPPPLDPQLIEQHVNLNTEVQILRGKIIEIDGLIVQEEFNAVDPNSRAIRRLRELREATQDQLDEVRARVEIEAVARLQQLNGGGGSAADAIEEIDSQIALWNLSIRKINDQMSRAIASLKGFEADTVALAKKSREVENLEDFTERMATKLQLLALEVNSPSPVTKLEDAHIPDPAGSWFIKVIIVLFVGIAGFVLGTGGVSFAEFQSRRVGSSEDISQGLGQTVVGTLPSLDGGLIRRGGGPHLQAMLSDSIDSIRATLVHNSSTDALRVVMVTSPLEREGKTTLASQLAASLARAGERTVLVDGDVRSPACHQLFELNADPGLSEVLREEAEVDDVVQATRMANLWLVPAGRYNSESIQALAKPAAADMFEQLRNKFDFVVIDASAVLTVADALLIGQHVDGAVLSVLRDVSRTPSVYQAAERLKSVGINLMGTVVSGENNRSQKRMYQRQLLAGTAE